ncbi:MAG: hypothetical protein M3297_10550 [Thermoproteota archaeon]|nr:hypothetical protein [Thermoproteota archaeon]
MKDKKISNPDMVDIIDSITNEVLIKYVRISLEILSGVVTFNPYTRKKKTIEDEEYVKWMFMLGEYYRGQRD